MTTTSTMYMHRLHRHRYMGKGGEQGREGQECTGCLSDPACIYRGPFAIITAFGDPFSLVYIKPNPQYSARPLSETPLPLKTPQWQTCLSETTSKGFRMRGYLRIRPSCGRVPVAVDGIDGMLLGMLAGLRRAGHRNRRGAIGHVQKLLPSSDSYMWRWPALHAYAAASALASSLVFLPLAAAAHVDGDEHKDQIDHTEGNIAAASTSSLMGPRRAARNCAATAHSCPFNTRGEALFRFVFALWSRGRRS